MFYCLVSLARYFYLNFLLEYYVISSLILSVGHVITNIYTIYLIKIFLNKILKTGAHTKSISSKQILLNVKDPMEQGCNQVGLFMRWVQV